MQKNKILSKLNIDMKDYNNELEKILENKLFSYSVKNLLLSMLYKIENAYKDYETAKVEALSKKDYIENILRIIREKALKIFLVKSGTPEAEELEKDNVKYKIDRKNGEITCFQNEFVILTALLKLDETEKEIKVPYDYIQKPLMQLINNGEVDSTLEVIRDFNGWSWDIVTNEILDIEHNFMYQTLLLLNGKSHIHTRKQEKITELIEKMAIQKYLDNKENAEYIEQFEKVRKSKEERLKLFDNKKEFLDRITTEKKEYTKQIEKIDKILNNNDLLKKEYYDRNERLPNKKKIFSVSYLVGILDKERAELLEKIEECNRIILPKEFVDQKDKLEKEVGFLKSISYGIKREDIILLSTEFLNAVEKIIYNIAEENKNNLIEWIYKIRYYRYIPVNEKEFVKDIKELDEQLKKIIEILIEKAQELKIWDGLSDNKEFNYLVLKEIFNTKIIYLQNINLQFRVENKQLVVEYYDDTVIDNVIKISINNVRVKKKVKLFE